MSKSVYQKYNEDALKHFGLESTPEYGVCSNSDGNIETIIATDSETIYNKIRDIINTSNVNKMGSWKRAFLLPNSPVSIDRVRSALKEHKVTLTSDVEAADVIITHDDFDDHFKSGNNINTTVMMAKIWNYETFKNSNSMPSSVKYSKDTLLNGKSNPIIYDDKVTKWFNLWNANGVETYDTLYDAWILTGMAVNLAHRIEIEVLPVMGVEDLMHQSANIQLLSEQLIKDLTRQIDSYNDEDNAMAGKILPTIDYESNYHLLWELANLIATKLFKFNRNKDVQYWVNAAGISDLANKTAENMILWLDEENKLNKENFRYLEPIVRKEIRIENRNLYVFKIQVKPEYRQYLKLKNK